MRFSSHSTLLCMCAFASATHATTAHATTAVLPVDASRIDGEAAPLDAAEALRARLTKNGEAVLPIAELTKRFADEGGAHGAPVDVQKTLSEAEAAYQAVDPERSVALLEKAVAALTSAPTVSATDATLLEEIRVRTAVRLLAIAGVDETGNGESAHGGRAKVHLMDALRANPTLALDAAKHPPKVRRLLDEARLSLAKAGTAGLTVDSTPDGASVFVEGRAIGKTPLALDGALVPGRYRLWIERDGARSRTRFVDVKKGGPPIAIDLAFEGALSAQGPSLAPLPGETVDERLAARVGTLLGVESLVLCGVARFDDARWLYAVVFDVAGGRAERRGAVRVKGDVPADEEIDALAAFLGERASADARPVPNVILPPKAVDAAAPSATTGPLAEMASETRATPAAAPAEDEGLPLGIIGLAAGGGALVVVVVGAIASGLGLYLLTTYATPPSEPVGRFDVVIE